MPVTTRSQARNNVPEAAVCFPVLIVCPEPQAIETAEQQLFAQRDALRREYFGDATVHLPYEEMSLLLDKACSIANEFVLRIQASKEAVDLMKSVEGNSSLHVMTQWQSMWIAWVTNGSAVCNIIIESADILRICRKLHPVLELIYAESEKILFDLNHPVGCAWTETLQLLAQSYAQKIQHCRRVIRTQILVFSVENM